MRALHGLKRFVVESSHSSFVRRWVLAHIPSNAVVLDVGAHDFPYTLESDAAVLYGIDIPDEGETTLGWSDEYARTLEKEKRVVPIYAMAEALPFRAESFDVVVCTEVLEHVKGDEQAVSEFARVLRSGGALLLTTPNGAEVERANPFHVRHYLREDLQSLLERQFDSVDLRTEFPNQTLYVRQYLAKGRLGRIFWRWAYEAWRRIAGRRATGGYTHVALARNPKTERALPDAAGSEGILACPVCKSGLGDDLSCTTCGNVYHRAGGIPVLVVPGAPVSQR